MKSKEKSSNWIVSNLISMGFDLLKHFLKDLENSRKVSKIDAMNEHFSTLENIILKMDRRLQETEKQIDDLKTKLMLSQAVVIVLLIVTVLQLFLG